jgi:hypothetical protein
MEMLKPPTDNLYKFMAIFGLLIFILSYIPIVHSQQLELEWTILQCDFDTNVTNPLNNMGIEMKTQTESLNKILQLINKKDNAEAAINIEKANKMLENIDIPDFKTKLGHFDEMIKRMNILIKKDVFIKYELYLGIISGIVGFILMCLGFYFWYSKLQKYQDMIIKKEAEGKVGK